jgi:hypothetical protein
VNTGLFITAMLAGWAVYATLLFFVARSAIRRFGQRWPTGLAVAAALPVLSALWVLSQREEWRRLDWDFSDVYFMLAVWLFIAGLPGVMFAISRAGDR